VNRIPRQQKTSKRASSHPDAQLDFGSLTEGYRRELLVHCYRILGSLEDAEDALQETLIRAWRQFDTLRSQASLRAWLYKIATNLCLNMLASRKARALPTAVTEPADPRLPLQAPALESVWLEPLPDEYIAGVIPSPEALYDTKESVTLAFLAALQILPGRQRAILILRDVLGWSIAEIGSILDQSVPAVNSALQRARGTMKKYHKKTEQGRITGGEQEAFVLARFVQAWETNDSDGLVALLREDAILTMPPLPGWYRGRDSIREFLASQLFADKQLRVIPTRANGCPALASYQRNMAGVYRPGAILILTLEAGQIVQVDDFLAIDDQLFRRFNLPLSL
jgi:RNA polymerase sigma-70 factor, ECF subfamily